MKQITRISTLALLAMVFTFVTSALAQYTETTLHAFGGVANDGIQPQTGLVRDAAGNLYGITILGGIGFGTAYELSPSSGGNWTETILYTFTSSPSGRLILDSSGNLYGVSLGGGANNKGAVYELSPGTGGWTQTVLYSFAGNPDAQEPTGSLIFDAHGNLYGTSFEGGGSTNANCFDGCGTVFEISPSAGGWTEKVIYAFGGSADGIFPNGDLLLDADGMLYGSTADGGTVIGDCLFGCSTIFRLTPVANSWLFARLFDFQGMVGGTDVAGLVFDAAGNLYGAASSGGPGCDTSFGCGVIFKLTRQTTPGPWKETVLHAFTQKHDGALPAGVVFDSAGNLFGTAALGGNGNLGTVWELSPTSHGPWALTQLYAFGNGANGGIPVAGVILDSSGNVYGTTQLYGQFGFGTVFELSPPASKVSN